MAVRPVINHLLVPVNPIDGRVGKLGGDGGHLLPGDYVGLFPDGPIGDEVGSGRSVTTKEDVQMIVLVRPDDGTEVVIRFALCRKPDGFGENPFRRVVGNEHRESLALFVLSRAGVSVVHYEKIALDENRLRALPGIVKHLELAILSERDDFGGGESLCVKQEGKEN